MLLASGTLVVQSVQSVLVLVDVLVLAVIKPPSSCTGQVLAGGHSPLGVGPLKHTCWLPIRS
jgi:hypothetical protein